MKTFSFAAASRPWLVTSLALVLGACAAQQPKVPPVEDRAQEWLDLYLAQDYAAAYGYLSPGYRSSVPSVAYQRKALLRKVRWQDGRLVGSECSENACKVKISLDYTVYSPVPGMKKYDGKHLLDQNWILSEGNWWLVPEE